MALLPAKVVITDALGNVIDADNPLAVSGAKSPRDCRPVTKSDSVSLPAGVLGLRVMATGVLAVKNAEGTTRTLTFSQLTEFHPFEGLTKILATGSTIANSALEIWTEDAA